MKHKCSKKHKELKIIFVKSNDEQTLITCNILYKNHNIGLFQMSKIRYPNLSNGLGSQYNTQYSYTIIFDQKDINSQLNIATKSIETNGFYQLNSGIYTNNTNIGLPIGIYENIGESPSGNKYNLKLKNISDTEIILIINKINN